jgi:hypothetical protein
LQDDIQQKPTDIIKYDFKNGLPQEFEIVDKVELYKESKDTLTTTHATGFYHIIWFQKWQSVTNTSGKIHQLHHGI